MSAFLLVSDLIRIGAVLLDFFGRQERIVVEVFYGYLLSRWDDHFIVYAKKPFSL